MRALRAIGRHMHIDNDATLVWRVQYGRAWRNKRRMVAIAINN
jgi:hypothetical protein